LSDSAPVDHHRSIDFRQQDFHERSDAFTIVRRSDGRHIQVIGVCPGCGGSTTTTWSFGSGNGYKGLWRRTPRNDEPVDSYRTVCCDCGHGHPNRPESAPFLGCGAYWRVSLG
jgi:hypothetical protein